MKKTLALLLCSLASTAFGGAFIDSGWLAGGLIPDKGGSSFSWERTGLPTQITGLTVSLSLSAPPGTEVFNGDLYATLQHSSGGVTVFSVLLNRPGRTATSRYGYGDNGMDIILDDAPGPLNGYEYPDVHSYRETSSTPLTGPLTGTWSTDGRRVDPNSVTEATLRTTSLLDFLILDPNGEWVLYVADTAVGGRVRLDAWRLEMIPIPEPAAWAWASVFGLAALSALRRRRTRL